MPELRCKLSSSSLYYARNNLRGRRAEWPFAHDHELHVCNATGSCATYSPRDARLLGRLEDGPLPCGVDARACASWCQDSPDRCGGCGARSRGDSRGTLHVV